MIEATFKDAKRSGVYRAPERGAVQRAVRAAGLALAGIDLSDVRDKSALLERVAAALAFPGWYGANWDALEDCLTDLSWRSPGGDVLVLEGQQVMNLPPEDCATFLDILRDASAYGAQQGRPFFAVFIDPARRLGVPDLPLA